MFAFTENYYAHTYTMGIQYKDVDLFDSVKMKGRLLNSQQSDFVMTQSIFVVIFRDTYFGSTFLSWAICQNTGNIVSIIIRVIAAQRVKHQFIFLTQEKSWSWLHELAVTVDHNATCACNHDTWLHDDTFCTSFSTHKRSLIHIFYSFWKWYSWELTKNFGCKSTALSVDVLVLYLQNCFVPKTEQCSNAIRMQQHCCRILIQDSQNIILCSKFELGPLVFSLRYCS